jgi:hypothetical protein
MGGTIPTDWYADQDEVHGAAESLVHKISEWRDMTAPPVAVANFDQ